MLKLAALPPLQSLDEGPSTVFWVAVRSTCAPLLKDKKYITTQISLLTYLEIRLPVMA